MPLATPKTLVLGRGRTALYLRSLEREVWN
jgi:hypothetical protein